MSLKLKNKAAVTNATKQALQRYEQALLFNLRAMVAELENHAKLSAGYQDQTSNLKSSIGGMVMKDGKIVEFTGFTGTGKGTETGYAFLTDIANQFKSGYALIIVAGMEYASYVENRHGLNVLAKSEMKMRRELPELLNRLKSKI